MNIKDLFDKYLNSKKNRIIAGCVTGLIVLGCGGGIVYATRDTTPNLKLNKEKITIEYGENIEMDVKKYLNTSDLNKEDAQDILKNTKITTNAEYSTIQEIDENGNLVAKEIGYPNCGDYKVDLKYKDQTKTVKVTVKDTTSPKMTVAENIEVLQGTDLATFDFKSLISVTDLAQMNELNVDYSVVDINTPAEYMVKASVEDVNKNKTEKEFKVTVIAPPVVAADEVVVQEEVTNPDGTKTVKNTVKKKTEASGNKVVSNGGNSSSASTSNKPSNSGSSNNGNSNNKPSNGGNSGSTNGNSNNNPSTGGSSNSGGSTDGNSNNKPSNGGSADVDISGSTPNGDYTDNWGGGQGNFDDIFG